MKGRKRRSVIWSISKLDFENIVKQYDTFSDILRHFNLYPHGGNQKTLKKRLNLELIDFSHISIGVSSRRGKKPVNNGPIPLNKVLVANSSYSRFSLKKRLIKENILENKCYECGMLPFWNNKILSLQLDHINGICDDNRIENLRIICPNCHAQTSNFAGKNKKRQAVIIKIIDNSWRKLPKLKSRKVEWPTKEALEKLLWEKPIIKIANDFGVSDVAVAKWIKSYGLSKPTKGHWLKLKT